MDFIQDHLLTLILVSPAVGALITLFLPKDNVKLIRWFAVIVSLVPLGLSIYLWLNYNVAQPGFQFEEQANWYEAVNSSYHLGVDGISVSMVLLTTLLTPLGLLISWSISEKVRSYMVLFLLLEAGMLGVFLSLDLWFFILILCLFLPLFLQLVGIILKGLMLIFLKIKERK